MRHPFHAIAPAAAVTWAWRQMAKKLSHYDSAGKAHMVDVSAKVATTRTAQASAFGALSPQVLEALPRNPKGNPLEVARLAGIMAAKRTAELIPLCHPLPLSHIDVSLDVRDAAVEITGVVETSAQTGVEMEALTAASIAALTIYDMCKAIDRAMVITAIRLESKS